MLLSIAFSLIFAGAVGNLIDRIRLHHVVDFLRFDFGSYTFPIFNIADSCAVVGTFLLLFCILFKMKDIDELLAQFKRSDANKRGIDSEN
jgi:signal peptidase II